MKTIIVAYDKHRGIGADNDLLWQHNLPADLHHFKEITMGNTIIMGRNTFESIGRSLPGRQNIVISHHDLLFDGVQITDSLQKAYDLVEAGKEAFVIGGGQIYSQAIDTVDRIIATEVDAIFDKATIFFPEIELSKFCETTRTKHVADERNLYDYDFVIYERY